MHDMQSNLCAGSIGEAHWDLRKDAHPKTNSVRFVSATKSWHRLRNVPTIKLWLNYEIKNFQIISNRFEIRIQIGEFTCFFFYSYIRNVTICPHVVSYLSNDFLLFEINLDFERVRCINEIAESAHHSNERDSKIDVKRNAIDEQINDVETQPGTHQ